MTVFVFDRNYKNLEQVAEFLPAFRAVLAEIEAAGQYRYNDSFKGRIPGIEGKCEDTAIYLLQCLDRNRIQDERVERLLAEGYEHIESVDGITRFRMVIFYAGHNEMRGEWQWWKDARLVPETKPGQIEATGRISSVLPKGKRSHGHFCNGRRVLVLR